MQNSTLALIQIENADEVFAALGQSSLDLFLAEFEERVGRFARDQDQILKVTPDKLCVLLSNVADDVQIELAGAKLARLFEAPISIVDEEFSARVHTAFVPPDGTSLDTKKRLRIAESGLMNAKKNGLDYVVQCAVAESSTNPLRRIREVEQAFERGEFVMYFQPQVLASYQSIVGAEALMRWHDPEQGVRAPAEFIPYLDQSALMAEVSWFAIKSSVAQAAEWPSSVSISVNVSPRLLHDQQLSHSVSDALSIFGLDPERLILEITEDAMIENPAETIAVLGRLRALGIKIAIDDFGTGYSSLGNFRDLPVDELKIDRSFVASMLTHPRDNDIVKSIIDLAHTFDMRVVAEGVEDEETAEALRALGADLLQGYWFAKPLPSEQFRRRLGH